MKNAFVQALFRQSFAERTASSLLASTAMLLCGLAVPTTAQTAIDKLAPEQGFTIPVRVSTPIVLKASPGAICDLHAEGEEGPDRSLTVYANTDGYLKFHAKPQQESDEEQRIQLDCTDTTGRVTRYPLNVRAASSPTPDMPAPQTEVPAPKGSTIRPALAEEERETLSNDELVSRGYPERPDAVESPQHYALWLKHVSQPITVLPPHQGDSGKSHHVTRAALDLANWSGYISTSGAQSFVAVSGTWNVPELVAWYNSSPTYSDLWVGLDGWGSDADLVQAGTQSASINIFGTIYLAYSSWTEIVPNESGQFTDLYPNPGDSVTVQVWICCGPGNSPTTNGTWGAFSITDWTQGTGVTIYTPLDGTHYNGNTIEWIMERPLVNGSYAYLADYDYANMIPSGDSVTQGWVSWNKLPDLAQIWMYNENYVGDDNNQLSGAYNHGSADINYVWYNFH